MKTLLICMYWHPWNNSGTFRWLGFAPYLDFDVLTSVEPVKSFADYTIPDPHKRVLHVGRLWPAKIWGLLAPITIFFKRYEWIIISSPPETLLIWAYLMQLCGRKVLVDMRDMIDRDALRGKFMRPIYRFCYARIRNIIVPFQFSDHSRRVVYHGYDNLVRSPHAEFPPVYYTGRCDYTTYNDRLTHGYLPDMSSKPDGYACSSIHNILHLGYQPNNDRMHPEVYTYTPISWEQGSEIIKQIIK